VRSKTTKWELVPHEVLEADFPGAVVHNFSHWMDLTSGEIEFRPLAQIWRSSVDNWILRMKAQPPCMTRTVKGIQESFIDYHSGTSRMVSSLLHGLEQRPAMYMVQRSSDGALVVTLPRLRLQFILKGQLLESIHFPGMFVDEQQTCGALIGLRDQLVLRPQQSQARYTHRQVLIPHGNVVISRADEHVHVSIEKPREDQHGYSLYNVDADMGRLSGETGLSSRLFKIYLHAATSHCLPDPLTGRTGVEEALEELSTAATQGGFTELTSPDLDLLDLIGSLSPRRDYYPSHLRCMETVQWSAAPLLAQHPAFAGLARAIVDYATVLRIFDTPPTSASDGELIRSQSKLRRKSALVVRSMERIKQFYPHGLVQSLGPDNIDHPQDVVHACRATTLNAHGEEGFVAAGSAILEVRQPHVSALVPLKGHLVSHTDSMNGPDHSLVLGYSGLWLSVSPSSWLSIYEAVRKGHAFHPPTMSAQHRLAFSLASMAWVSPPLRPLVPLLVLLSLRTSSPEAPHWPSYDLSEGHEVGYQNMSQKVKAHKLPFDFTPLHSERKHPGESTKQFKARCRQLYITTPQELSVLLANHFTEQHPLVGVLTTPRDDGTFRPWFDMPGCVDSASSYLLAVSQNIELFNHLDEVHSTLRQQRVPSNQSHRLPLLSYDADRKTKRLRLAKADSHVVSASFTLDDQVGQFALSLAQLSDIVELKTSQQFSLAVTSPHHPRSGRSSSTLSDIIKRLREAADRDSLEDIHGKTLQQSLLSLASHVAIDTPLVSITSWVDVIQITEDNTRYWMSVWSSRLSEIKQLLELREEGALNQLNHVSAIAPRVTLRALLRLLSYGHRQNIPTHAQRTLKQLATGYMLHQQMRRLCSFAAQRDLDGFSAEYASWRVDDREETLDDLLLQVNLPVAMVHRLLLTYMI
jgi:hypothetical protein